MDNQIETNRFIYLRKKKEKIRKDIETGKNILVFLGLMLGVLFMLEGVIILFNIIIYF